MRQKHAHTNTQTRTYIDTHTHTHFRRAENTHLQSARSTPLGPHPPLSETCSPTLVETRQKYRLHCDYCCLCVWRVLSVHWKRLPLSQFG